MTTELDFTRFFDAVPKLTDKNFRLWKRLAMNDIKMLNLDYLLSDAATTAAIDTSTTTPDTTNVVGNSASGPTAEATTNPPIQPTNAIRQIYDTARRTSDEKKLLTLLLRWVSEKFHYQIENCSLGSQAWKELLVNNQDSEEYELGNAAMAFFTMANSFTGGNLQEYILDYEKHLNTIRKFKPDFFKDEMLIYHFIGVIEKASDDYVLTCEHLLHTKASWDTVKQSLIQRYNNLKKMKKEKEIALLISNGNQDRKYKNVNHSRPATRQRICYICRKPNHQANDCWHKKQPYTPKDNKRKQNEFKKVEHANAAQVQYALCSIANFVETKTLCGENEQNLGELKNTEKSTEWILDSGASRHITCQKRNFVSLLQLDEPVCVSIADGKSINAYFSGTVNLKFKTGKIIKLCDVLFIPEFKFNLLSATKLTDEHCSIQLCDNQVKILQLSDNSILGDGQKVNGLYILNAVPTIHSILLSAASDVNESNNNLQIWHARLGHASNSMIQTLCKQSLVTGLDLTDSHDNCFCEICLLSKKKRFPFPRSSSTSSHPLQLVHSDIAGPFQENGLDDSRYFIIFVDDYSRFVWVYPVQKKNAIYNVFEEFIISAENLCGFSVKTLRSDNGSEYLSNEFKLICQRYRIAQQCTVVYTPQQNGVSERYIQTIVTMCRSMLTHFDLPKSYWSYAVRYAAWIKNRLQHPRIKHTTPHETFTKIKPSLSFAKTFGCAAYAWIATSLRQKLDYKSSLAIFVGVSSNRKGYILLNIDTLQPFVCRDVTFCESRSPASIIPNSTIKRIKLNLSTSDSGEEKKYKKDSEVSLIIYTEPTSYKDITTAPDVLEWKLACQDELNAIELNKTWTIVDRPSQNPVIHSGWVLKLKRNDEGKPVRRKARLVCRGNEQVYGLNYTDTYAPVVRWSSLRLILHIAATLNLEILQADVTTAFLNGVIEEDVYVEAPIGFPLPNGKVYKLNKSLYGTKQAPRAWNKTLDRFLKKIGFIQLKSESCIYTKGKYGEETYIIIIVYVDDMLLCGKYPYLSEIVTALQTEYKMNEITDVDYFLKIKIKRDRLNRKIFLNQTNYIEDIFNKFANDKMKSENRISTSIIPLDSFKLLYQSLDSIKTAHPYRELVGSIMYLMTCTRPDIAFTISLLSRFQSRPNDYHYSTLLKLLSYLKSTSNLELEIGNSDGRFMQLVGYSDADWGSSLDDRKSTSGYLVKVGASIISWSSKKQNTVATSTAEAEYYSIYSLTQETQYIKTLLNELGIETINARIYCDNQSSIAISNNPSMHSRTKHIDIKYHFIRELVETKQISITYIKTDNQEADGFTKLIDGKKLKKFINHVNLRDNKNLSDRNLSDMKRYDHQI